MADSIRVSNTSRVLPVPTSDDYHPPLLSLSFLDAFWTCIGPVQRLLFYRSEAPLASVVLSLKASLSVTLGTFYPLSGKLALSADSGDLFIDYGAGGEDDGVEFTEAKTDENLERLVTDHAHHWETYKRLMPDMRIERLPAPLLAVKVTGFRGGFTVGVSVHHVAGDGNSFSRFVKAWAETCRSGGDAVVMREAVTFDRAVVWHPRNSDICRSYLDVWAPSRPTMTFHTFVKPTSEIARRTFIITTKMIQSLKRIATETSRNGDSTQTKKKPPSTFVAVAAHAWTCITRARATEDGVSTMFFMADCRSRVDPPIPQGFFGNCVKVCNTKSNVADLSVGEGHGFRFACDAIERTIKEETSEPFRGCEEWVQRLLAGLPDHGRIVNFAGSHRFGFYKADFGWGRPSRVEFVSMPNEGAVVMNDARDDEGGVQLSLTLPPHDMEVFATMFLDGMDGLGSDGFKL
ncbi:Malonyl-CoA:anthocyanidin 5-O-glucoside-6''-O-malonyltransferase [Acorus gramineus]|uniref:Malonyl-CoA:anthocyanidin 5-O-glucoside-6''-O-malonyltransferase n=1 Tax=Acorus gramineus TaxID=55184 RepID=A0AAV8ZV68_ACOGR|nr:Malonyl-CoA:anthocyanidin 5-O-glucoside-6''-O-malonyltransferase [Acorus gramineus]